jgi:transcriptional regulator with XRE-family HTH domain
MKIQSESSHLAILEELGSRLARHRLNLNLSQEQIAEKAGLGVNTISRIEQGKSTQLSNFIRVLRALELVENLELLVPRPPQSPIELAKVLKEQRLRASSRRDKVERSHIWKWDDER